MSAPIDASGQPPSLLQAAAAGTGRSARLAAAWALGQAAAAGAKKLETRIRAEVTFSVTIESSDELYQAVHQRIVAILPAHRQRALTARTAAARPGDQPTPDGGGSPSTGVQYFYDGSRQQTVQIGGHRVRVTLEKEQAARLDSDSIRMSTERIRFAATSLAGQRAVRDLLSELAAEQAGIDRLPGFKMAGRWGGWDDRKDLPVRTLDTVVLAEGQRERIVADLDRFFALEADYARLGRPWHRGLLLHGPAGTGKTSVAKALANHFGLDVYYVPLADLTRDADVLNLVSSIRPRSMLLLEDIDVLTAATTRTEGVSGLTLSGLLNALDGVFTPHGLITVMTTNHRESLDPALIRPGRIGLDELVDHVTLNQVERLFELVFGHRPTSLRTDVSRLAAGAITAAQVVEILTAHPGDPSAAQDALARTLRSHPSRSTP